MAFSKESLADLSFWEHKDRAGDFENLHDMASALVKGVLSRDVPISVVRRLLESDQPRLREFGAYVASELGVHCEALLPNIIEALNDSASEVRYYTASAVLALGNTAIQAALPRIVSLLLDPERSIRKMAIRLLLHVPEDDFHGGLDRITDEFAHESASLHRVLPCLNLANSRRGDCVHRLLLCLSDQAAAARLAAVVSALRSGIHAIRVVEEALTHHDAEIRDVAAAFAHVLGDSIAPSLIDVLRRDADETVLASALHSLAEIPGVDFGESRPIVLSQLGHANSSVRYGALCAMRRLLPLTSEELLGVLACLRDEAESVRYMAGVVVVKTAGLKSNGGVDHLVDELFGIAADRSFDAQVRSDVLFALGDCSPDALRSTLFANARELVGLLDEHDDHIVLRTLYLAVRCGELSQELKAAISKVMSRSRCPDIRSMAARALAN